MFRICSRHLTTPIGVTGPVRAINVIRPLASSVTAQISCRRFTSSSSETPKFDGKLPKAKISPLKIGLALSVATLGIYWFSTDKRERESACIDFAIKNDLATPLKCVSKERLIQDLFYAVHDGNFAKAKFLIEKGEISVNTTKTYFGREGDPTSALLEEFYPQSEADLEAYIDFATFLLENGYRHMNRPIYKYIPHPLGLANWVCLGDPCNLISSIYEKYIFCNNTILRRKLIEFFLRNGVNPNHVRKQLGGKTGNNLFSASRNGDVKFISETCQKLGVKIHLNKTSQQELFEAVIIYGYMEDVLYLCTQNLKIESKDVLLKLLKSWSFQYSTENYSVAEAAIKKMN